MKETPDWSFSLPILYIFSLLSEFLHPGRTVNYWRILRIPSSAGCAVACHISCPTRIDGHSHLLEIWDASFGNRASLYHIFLSKNRFVQSGTFHMTKNIILVCTALKASKKWDMIDYIFIDDGANLRLWNYFIFDIQTIIYLKFNFQYIIWYEILDNLDLSGYPITQHDIID